MAHPRFVDCEDELAVLESRFGSDTAELVVVAVDMGDVIRLSASRPAAATELP